MKNYYAKPPTSLEQAATKITDKVAKANLFPHPSEPTSATMLGLIVLSASIDKFSNTLERLIETLEKR